MPDGVSFFAASGYGGRRIRATDEKTTKGFGSRKKVLPLQ
jgi:hypothetical protein